MKNIGINKITIIDGGADLFGNKEMTSVMIGFEDFSGDIIVFNALTNSIIDKTICFGDRDNKPCDGIKITAERFGEMMSANIENYLRLKHK